MQWKLISLGLKSGAKVWAPRGDQARITGQFAFNKFEQTFTAGLDAQTKYVENIDVVWKEAFRIDAAFEVENTTSIYSGLLRFADLAQVSYEVRKHIYVYVVSKGPCRDDDARQIQPNLLYLDGLLFFYILRDSCRYERRPPGKFYTFCKERIIRLKHIA